MITKSRGAIKPKTGAELDARPRRALPKTNGAARRLTMDRRPDLRNTSLPTGIAANDPDALEPLKLHRGAETPAAATGPPSAADLAVVRELPLERIEISADNPRTHFDEDALQQLAVSILAHGLIQPIVVRPMGALAKNFELVAGERRYRAAKLAGLKTVRVEVRILSDGQAAEIRLIENLEREDLTAIEEAAAMEKMIGQLGYTQERLAERLKCSQPHIANRLRLLKLPKTWQAKIISREIPATHARELVKYSEHPTLVKAISDQFFGAKASPEIGPLASFADDLAWVARAHLQEIEGERWNSDVGRSVKYFKPTAENREQLGIIELDGEEYATNVKLWRKLREKQLANLAKEKPAKKGKGKASDKITRSPAEVKAAKAKAATQLKRWIEEWRTNWLRWILARRVIEDGKLAGRVVLMAIARGHGIWGEASRVATLLEGEAMHKVNPHSDALLKHIAVIKEPAGVLIDMAAGWLWRDDDPKGKAGGQPWPALSTQCVEALAVAESIELAEEWKQDLAGPLTESFYNRHPREAIEDLANWFNVQRTGATKRELVDLVMNVRDLRTQMPSSIKPVATVATGRKPKKKGGTR